MIPFRSHCSISCSAIALLAANCAASDPSLTVQYGMMATSGRSPDAITAERTPGIPALRRPELANLRGTINFLSCAMRASRDASSIGANRPDVVPTPVFVESPNVRMEIVGLTYENSTKVAWYRYESVGANAELPVTKSYDDPPALNRRPVFARQSASNEPSGRTPFLHSVRTSFSGYKPASAATAPSVRAMGVA